MGAARMSEQAGGMADRFKIAAAVALALAGLAGFYFLGERAMIIRVFAVLAGFAAAAAVFATSQPGREFYGYSQESIAETKKVVWPTRKETLQTTGIVFAFVVVMALFLWVVDVSLLWIVKKLLG
ncbi:MAG: preprotein translocase subunit SecE [Burkholderiales bacterium]|nr:preprotein translocase subunit SecE [Burkholderiales bacterium]